MSKSKIGFHTGPGGNKKGIGDWERAANDAGVPFGMKAVDEYGPIHEAVTIGRERNVQNWLGFRLTHASGKLSREVPDYNVDPALDAPNLCQELIDKLPPEFDQSVWLEVINEPRAENKEGDTMFNNMEACDYLGEWCLAAAKFMNDRGYKFAGPSFNSGEPGYVGKGLADAVTQYSQPGMLKYLRYCAENPAKAALSVHEYSWSLWQEGETAANWYPTLWGRFEAAIAAADLNGIPRTFPILVTEFGFAHNEAPEGHSVFAFLDARNRMTARFPQLKFDAAWTLQNYQNAPIDNHVNSWMAYSILKNFDEGKQPAKTHEAFGGTLPGAQISDATPVADPGTTTTIPISDPVDGGSPLPKHAIVIDVSGHNTIDWNTIRCDGALVRTSNGILRNNKTADLNGIDRAFWPNVKGLKARGLPFGFYHFYNENFGFEQITHFLGIVREAIKHGFAPSLGLWLDFEESSPQDEAAIRAGCEALLRLNDTGQPVGIYTRANWWNARVPSTATWPRHFLIWTANWVSSEPIDKPARLDFRFLTPHHWQNHQANVWQFSSKGGNIVGHEKSNLDVNYWLGFENVSKLAGGNDPQPVVTGTPVGGQPTAVTTGTVVDVLPFIRGTHRRQFDKEYKLSGNGQGGTQTTQIWHINQNNWLYIKGENGEYERLGVRQFNGEDWIFRFEDTSESAERFYAHYLSEGGPIGAPWVPCKMEVGRWYETPKFVQHYHKKDAAKLNSGQVTDRIRLVASPGPKTYAESGQTVESVITLEWTGGEQYDFADGNIAFRDATRNFWFMAHLDGRPDKQFDKPKNIDLGWNF